MNKLILGKLATMLVFEDSWY